MSHFTISLDNADLLDANHARWLNDPDSVDPSWRSFFEGFELGCIHQDRVVRESLEAPEPTPVPAIRGQVSAPPENVAAEDPVLQRRVDLLIYAYRDLGHTLARLDPISPTPNAQPLLSLEEFGLTETDMDRVVGSQYYLKGKRMPLREMIASLTSMYCSTVGVEFMHITNRRIRNWIRECIETRPHESSIGADKKQQILRILLEAESFENFLHTKYVGQKRFSLEGGESLMVILETVLGHCGESGIKEIVMGMAHRGRLTVLANFLHKSFRVLFNEFSENYVPNLVGGDGDVKYHLGYESRRETPSGEDVTIRLAANPSHLEAVDPVVQGKSRARQRILKDTAERKKVLPLLIHGDAAFAGQGIVTEVLNMSQLPGYRTGGTVHVIVNNQIGFTTMPADARSTSYATDVAKMIEAPIFHVNGDDPLAAMQVAAIALDFRQQFGRDVVIDLYCYRRHGHNEGDEPGFTQPKLYASIQSHPTPSQVYQRHLVETGVLSQDAAEALDDEYQQRLETTLQEVREIEEETRKMDHGGFTESSAIFQPPYSHEPVRTAIPREMLEKVAGALSQVPEGFNVHPKIRRILLDRRARVLAEGGPFDWSYAEALAFGSLMVENIPVRLSGQDSRRGTFSQRHSVLHDLNTRGSHIPLMHIEPGQATFCVYNSLLSEAAVLGFDYGYSMDYPSMLCIWEAQFGDFANGAQVIIDQFIAASESKWGRPSGLVMLLPHGYEGQGPEHSSARPERFLQLCADDNIQVCIPTSPAQYFHLLRRQMHRPFRKPLIIFTPKSLLRSELCVSRIADFTSGCFREILDSPRMEGSEPVESVIFCTGKIYYDLLQYRLDNNIRNTGIVRLEQIYPLNEVQILQVAATYPDMQRVVWCQEEPQNMGAWNHIGLTLSALLDKEISYAGRPPSPAPAGGSLALHKKRQIKVVEEAFQL